MLLVGTERSGCLAAGTVQGDGGPVPSLFPTQFSDQNKWGALSIPRLEGVQAVLILQIRTQEGLWGVPSSMLIGYMHLLIKIPCGGLRKTMLQLQFYTRGALGSIKHKHTELQNFYREGGWELPREGELKCFHLLVDQEFKKYIFKIAMQCNMCVSAMKVHIMCKAF